METSSFGNLLETKYWILLELGRTVLKNYVLNFLQVLEVVLVI